jgi:hypothetical protein
MDSALSAFCVAGIVVVVGVVRSIILLPAVNKEDLERTWWGWLWCEEIWSLRGG